MLPPGTPPVTLVPPIALHLQCIQQNRAVILAPMIMGRLHLQGKQARSLAGHVTCGLSKHWFGSKLKSAIDHLSSQAMHSAAGRVLVPHMCLQTPAAQQQQSKKMTHRRRGAQTQALTPDQQGEAPKGTLLL